MAKVGAIVLAGGRSSRFGRDKLAEPIGGRPLLAHAVEAVALVASTVVVVRGDQPVPALSADVLVVRDPRPFEGPLAAVATGLAALDAEVEIAIIVGGDMPSLVPAVLQRLAAALADHPALDAAVLDAAGMHRPLPMAVRRAPAHALATMLLGAGERSLRALRDGLDGTALPDAEWRQDDPAGRTLRDVDVEADLPSPDRG